MRIECPNCKAIYPNVPEAHLGKSANCKRCQTKFKLEVPDVVELPQPKQLANSTTNKLICFFGFGIVLTLAGISGVFFSDLEYSPDDLSTGPYMLVAILCLFGGPMLLMWGVVYSVYLIIKGLRASG